MFDELKTAVTHLREVSTRIHVDVIDGKDAAELVRISEDARRTIDGLRTSAIGRVGTTEAWRDGGSKNSAEWVALHTGTPIYEAQSTLLSVDTQSMARFVRSLVSGQYQSQQRESI